MSKSRVPGPDNLYVGGIWVLNLDSHLQKLYEDNITHVLSVINFSDLKWSEESNRFKHMSIDVIDDLDADLLVHFPSAVRFIENGLYPPAGDADTDVSLEGKRVQTKDEATSPGGVYVHCAMGISRSVSCVIAYLLYRYPHRYGDMLFAPSVASSAARRRQTSKQAVESALEWVRKGRPAAQPNDSFMSQLELWWEMGCPADNDNAVEQHPVYQKWLYEKMLKESRDICQAPEAKQIRFEDEVEQGDEAPKAEDGKECRCKKCRCILATPKFVVPHAPDPTKRREIPNCAHIFIETLSWMLPALEDGALEGRLSCPNTKCGATVGRFAWQGLKCSCGEWVVPAFSLNRSRVDEVVPRRTEPPAIRLPPGRNGNL